MKDLGRKQKRHTWRRHRIFEIDFVDLWGAAPRLSAAGTVARVQERVLQRLAGVDFMNHFRTYFTEKLLFEKMLFSANKQKNVVLNC
jgi:hypothetical protein